MREWDAIVFFCLGCFSGMAKYFQCAICGCQEAGGKS